MEKRELYKFYTFGWDFNIMCDPFDGITVSVVKNIIRKFKIFVNLYDFKIAKQAMGNEIDVISNMIKVLPDTDKISSDVRKSLKDFSTKFEVTIDAELKSTHAYILSEKRLGLNRLLNNTEELFGENVFKNFTNQAQKDFTEAGNCLAFERYTASAFHILRATEEMLVVY